jgi:preprotein translocase subunit SecA
MLEREPTQEGMTEIGNAILASNRNELRIEGGDADDVARQADRIGFSFLRQYLDAKGLTTVIDAAPSKDPVAVGRLRLRDIEKTVLLQTLDHLWREHLVTLEHLRQVIGFRSYAQRDPLNEYKSEAFQLFEAMLARLREAVTGQLMNVKFGEEPQEPAPEPLPPMQAHHINPTTGEDEFALAEAALSSASRAATESGREARPAPNRTRKTAGGVDPNNPETWGRVARNDKCPCGSGKKFKHCHGRI